MKKLKPAILIDAIIFDNSENAEMNLTGELSRDNLETKTQLSNKILQNTLADTKEAEQSDYLIPKIKNLPTVPLTPAEIYIPTPIDKTTFEKVKEHPFEVIETENKTFSVFLYKELLARKLIRAYKDEIYLFFDNLGVYKRLSDRDFDYLINENFGLIIEKKGDLRLYAEIKEYIKKCHELVVDDGNLPPLRFWCFCNGFVDIFAESHYANDGRYFVRHVLQCDYSPHEKCPIFDQFIYSITAGDTALSNLMWEIIGYLLSNDTNAKVFFAFVGLKDSGKSLMAHVISNIVGRDAISYLSAHDLSGRFAVSELEGKSLNVCMDLPNRPLSPEIVAIIKASTGNDVMHSDVKYKDSIHFRPTARFLFGSNYLIKTEQSDPAFYDRMIIAPFNYSVPKEKQDFQLETKLNSEKAGIAAKAMFTYKVLVAKKYVFTQVGISEEMESSTDYNKVLKTFAKEICIFTDSDSDKIPSINLFGVYENFCHSKGISPQSFAEFSRKFNELFTDKVTKKKIKFGGESLNGFTHLRLKTHQ